MSDAGSWVARRSVSGRTEHIRLFHDDQPLQFRNYFTLLQDDPGFASWYAEQLSASPFAAFFWEHPPLLTSNVDSDAELVLIDAPMLDTMQPDTNAFCAYFANDAVVSFRNIGGDAVLVAPSPVDRSADYVHLAAFLRTAPQGQVRALWQITAQSVVKLLSARPMWLSTSGLGVAWLHIRLDSSPKYYQHQPYRAWPAAIGRDEKR